MTLVTMFLMLSSQTMPQAMPQDISQTMPQAMSKAMSKTMVASWYGKPYHGRATASGEIYDMNQMTAAHRYLPFGARLVVTYQGRSGRIRITDRGPFIDGRDLDLSRAAAERLGMIGVGVAKISVEEVYNPKSGLLKCPQAGEDLCDSGKVYMVPVRGKK